MGGDPRQEADTGQLRGASDAEGLRAAYERWLGDGVQVLDFTAPEGAGFSSETFVVDLRDRDGTPRRQVLRTVPEGITTFRDYDLGRQVACMRQLAGHLPVPSIEAYEQDPAVLGRPFYVMGFVDGRIPDDNPPYTLVGWMTEADADEQRRIYTSTLDAIARLHRLDPAAAGLDGLAYPDLGADGLTQQLAFWTDLADWAGQGRPMPTLDAARAWLLDNLPADPGPDVVNWGDARVSNTVYVSGEPAALLDWEMAAVGPGEVDLGWYLYMDEQLSEALGAPRLPGWPGDEALVARYEQAVGREVRDLDWYRVFAGFRFATVMMRVAQRMLAAGHVPEDSDVERNNLATRQLARVLSEPEPGPVGIMG